MERLLAYQDAGLEPPAIIMGPRLDGPQDLLDEPMQLSLADKAKLGLTLEHQDGFNSEHLQWELRMALEKIHSNAGHSQPIGGAPAENKPLDGMDPVSSALLMELAATVMPDRPQTITNEAKYSRLNRKAAIKRWMEKRARRHLTSQTKYRKMKDVAVSKARCKGGKFIKKSERERMAREEAEAAAAKAQAEALLAKDPAMYYPAPAVKGAWGEDTEWQRAYNFLAQREE